jgi:hypothetical protein
MANLNVGPEHKALDARSDGLSPKRRYQTPEVRLLGKVKDLTLNSSTVASNDTIFGTPNTKNSG